MTNRTLLSEEISKGTKYLAFGLALIFILSGSLFLLSVSVSSQNGYKFRQEELVREKLAIQNRQLQLKVLQATSFEKLKEEPVLENMIPVRNIEFYTTRYERLSRLDPQKRD